MCHNMGGGKGFVSIKKCSTSHSTPLSMHEKSNGYRQGSVKSIL